MKIYEQADQSSKAPCGAVYSWIADGASKNSPAGRRLIADGWKHVAGHRGGSFVTNNPALAAQTALALDCDIVTNGTHAVHNVPVLLCDSRS